MTTTTTPNTDSNHATPVTKVHFTGGTTPSATEAKKQVEAQKALNTTVTDPKALEGMTLPTDKSEPAKTDKPEAEPKDDPTEKAMARANRLEAAARKKDQQLKEAQARLAALESTGVKAKELEEILDTGKKQPLKAISKVLGVPEHDVIRFISDYVINGEIKAPDPSTEKLTELEQKVKSFEEDKRQAEIYAQQSATYDAMVGYLSQVNQAITDPDKHELTIMKSKLPAQSPTFRNAASEDAWQLANEYYATYGEVPDPALIAETLEKHYEVEAEEEIKLFQSAKKLQKKLGLTEKETKEVIAQAKKPESPTLGQLKTQSPPLEKREYKNDKERMDAIVAWGRSQLGQSAKQKTFVDPRKK